MNSMFKKKGGLAFKPKAPVVRARPSTLATKPTATPTPQPTTEVSPETTPNEQPDSAEGEPRYDSSGRIEPQKESPNTTRQSTRRASHCQQSDTARPQTEDTTTASQRDESVEPSPSAEAAGPAAPASQPELIRSIRTGSQSAAEVPSQSPKDTAPDETQPLTEEAVASEPTRSTTEESQEALTTATTEEPAAATAPKAAPKRAARKRCSKASKNASPDDGAAPGGSTRPRKCQKRTTQQENGQGQTPAPRKRKTTSVPNVNGSRSRPRRPRSPTPEDAETQVVDLQKLKMSDLTKDLRIGKKFSRHDELRERERERKARLKAKPEKDGDTTSEAVDGTNNNKASQSPAPDGTRPIAKPDNTAPANRSVPAPAPSATSGPQFRIVDGQIVVDQNSLVMDRHARAAAARSGEDMETVEENDFTHLITSASFMNTSKLKGPNHWTEAETELFYRGLRMFGTEFEMISRMFPGKQRRHVKLKFNREERHNPELIDAALIGEKTIKMDIDEYRAFTGTEYESVETIEAEHRKIEESYEAERQRIADEQAEIMRKKREELFADPEDGSRKRKKAKGKQKQPVQYGLDGRPIVQQEA